MIALALALYLMGQQPQQPRQFDFSPSQMVSSGSAVITMSSREEREPTLSCDEGWELESSWSRSGRKCIKSTQSKPKPPEPPKQQAQAKTPWRDIDWNVPGAMLPDSCRVRVRPQDSEKDGCYSLPTAERLPYQDYYCCSGGQCSAGCASVSLQKDYLPQHELWNGLDAPTPVFTRQPSCPDGWRVTTTQAPEYFSHTIPYEGRTGWWVACEAVVYPDVVNDQSQREPVDVLPVEDAPFYQEAIPEICAAVGVPHIPYKGCEFRREHCADKTRILLTSEDGEKHCVSLKALEGR